MTREEILVAKVKRLGRHIEAHRKEMNALGIQRHDAIVQLQQLGRGYKWIAKQLGLHPSRVQQMRNAGLRTKERK